MGVLFRSFAVVSGVCPECRSSVIGIVYFEDFGKSPGLCGKCQAPLEPFEKSCRTFYRLKGTNLTIRADSVLGAVLVKIPAILLFLFGLAIFLWFVFTLIDKAREAFVEVYGYYDSPLGTNTGLWIAGMLSTGYFLYCLLRVAGFMMRERWRGEKSKKSRRKSGTKMGQATFS